MAIPIKGVIGWDVIGTEFARQLNRLSGDIDFEIDSPGGSVFDGISIFNAIQDYDRGKCRIHVVGDCSSMAAYIMLAGDTLDFKDNSIVVLHNPWNFTQGDYRAMQKSANLLEKLADMYAKKFVEKGIFEYKAMREIMDAETWFVGENDLKQLGKVLKSGNSSGKETDKELKIAALQEKMKDCQSKLAGRPEDFDKIAALIQSNIPQGNTQQPAANKPNLPPVQSNTQQPAANKPNLPPVQSNTQSSVNNNSTKTEKGAKAMNLEELKAQEPALFAQVLAMGEKDGIEKERDRVNAFMGFMDVDKDATIKALKEGKNINDNAFQASILMARVKADTLQGMQDESPADVDPNKETHAPETKDGGKQADDEAAKAEKEQQAQDAKDFTNIMALCGVEGATNPYEVKA